MFIDLSGSMTLHPCRSREVSNVILEFVAILGTGQGQTRVDAGENGVLFVNECLRIC